MKEKNSPTGGPVVKLPIRAGSRFGKGNAVYLINGKPFVHGELNPGIDDVDEVVRLYNEKVRSTFAKKR